ncbi:hypothetical protein [Bradyrhizobium sp. CCGB20]|uniref:hypothetical protein n=1 Tax=Bradyrhizobium sp. CCGB20 TaxID=2949633 RepID=UPI0020B20F93|nr:hypothetical protein [Bradyrhizobium sp. CCGB20]MCP3397143.1 hypothetical protein [Bradyrhizobium sp. CCGB20]
MVKSATLHEISLVGGGACKPAFCSLVDADADRSLEIDSKTRKILNDGAARDFMRALQNLADAFEQDRR